MASLILRHKSQNLIPKSHKSILIFNHFFSSDNDGNGPVDPQQPPSKAASFDEIRKNLSGFRRRSSENPIPTHSIDQIPNIKLNPNPNPNPNRIPNPSFMKGGGLSFDEIRESVQKMRENSGNNVNEKLSLNNYKDGFRVNPTMPKGNVIGGSVDSLPNAFGKEIKEKEMNTSGEEDMSKYDLARMYSHDELGEKLKELRPDSTTLEMKKEKEGWFSLSELQQRLGKLREMETKVGAGSGAIFTELRESLKAMQLIKDNNKPKKDQKLDIFSQPSFTTSPPKDHLVEKYFHPDNLSSAEKLKIKLKKVRDEFKMSDLDCGSTRVQIAQLTTEIHHLSSMLHKKDKHSRRGLHLKVQRRKKLLKYLRRTDWDSYCLVLSKLGLRDNPDNKN